MCAACLLLRGCMDEARGQVHLVVACMLACVQVHLSVCLRRCARAKLVCTYISWLTLHMISTNAVRGMRGPVAQWSRPTCMSLILAILMYSVL